MKPVGNAIAQIGMTLGNLVGGMARGAVRRIALTPPYLGHLLYLISQEFRDLAKQGFGSNAAVYACIQLLCTSIPEPPLVAYYREINGEPDSRKPLDSTHPLRKLIRNPNPLMTEFHMWEMITIHLALVGRSVWFKERDRLGNTMALWPLRPDRVGPIYSKPEDTEEVILGWSYLIPGTTTYIAIPRNDVAFYVLPDPLGESGGIVEGKGPLQALATEVSADNAATSHVSDLLSNYASPGAILQVQHQLQTEDDVRLIKAGFMRDFGGARRGQPAIVDQGTTIEMVGFSLQQLEFPQLRRISESRIAAAFGVPAIMVGLLVGLESGIRATLGEMREFFTETTCSGYWRRYGDAFTNQVSSEWGEDIVCRFDLTRVRALTMQTLANADRMERAFLRGAIYVNEYRASLGLPDLGAPEVPGSEAVPDPLGWSRILPPKAVQVDQDGTLYGAAVEALEAEETAIDAISE